MEISIELLKEQDGAEVFQFEYDNQAFFEKMVPSRGEEYFHHFSEKHAELFKGTTIDIHLDWAG